MQKRVNLVDLVKELFEPDSYANEYLLAKIGVDTAEDGPLKVCQNLFSQQLENKLEQTQARRCRARGRGRMRPPASRRARGRATGSPAGARRPLGPRRPIGKISAGKMLLVFGCIGTDLCK